MITLTQAAEISGFTSRNLRRAIKAGTLKADKPGHDYLLEQSELERWLNDTSAHKRGRKQK